MSKAPRKLAWLCLLITATTACGEGDRRPAADAGGADGQSGSSASGASQSADGGADAVNPGAGTSAGSDDGDGGNTEGGSGSHITDGEGGTAAGALGHAGSGLEPVSASVRLVSGVHPPSVQGAFILRSSGFVGGARTCAGALCVRGFVVPRSREP